MLTTLSAAASVGCRKQEAEPQEAEPQASAAASARAPARALPPHEPFRIPSGPVLAILKGEGVGPIRIGATTATIERLMDRPCDVKSETLCRYIGRAVDFRLEDGVTKEIHVHRENRTAGDQGTFGIFHGRFPEGPQFGMYPQAVIKELGPPKEVEKVEEANPFDTIEVHHYDGMRLEYDKLPNGNVVLGGVVIRRD